MSRQRRPHTSARHRITHIAARCRPGYADLRIGRATPVGRTGRHLCNRNDRRIGARLLSAAAVRRRHTGVPRPVIGHDEAATTEREIRGLLYGATFENERQAGGGLDNDQLATLVAAADR